MRSRFGELEVLCRFPEDEPRPTPLLLIHGAYAAAWCWDEHFSPYLASRGYACYALSLSGHGRSRGREHLDSLSIADYVRDLREVMNALPSTPVLIGHSMGGMVAQKYLEIGRVPAVVLMASVPPQGLWASAIGLAFNKPGLLRDLNTLMGGGRMALESLREALFAQPVSADRLLDYARKTQLESHRAIWDMTLFDLPQPHRMSAPPMLVLGAEHDQLIPRSLVELTAHTYGVHAEIYPSMGHAMMLERDWKNVADRILDWLGENGL